MSILHIAMIGAAVTMVPTQQSTAKEVHVQYGDLDLASPSGRVTLDRRLTHAVNIVCGKASGKPLDQRLDIRKCQKQVQVAIAPQRQLAIAEKGGVRVATAD
jgi:UrcA family protein